MKNDKAPHWPDDPALFLDLDGTLLDFALEPSSVVVPTRLRLILERLPAATDEATAIVSGRSLADVDRLLGPHRFPAAAVHGLVRRDATGNVWKTDGDGSGIAEIKERLKKTAEGFPGTLVEDKETTVAIHYRRCPDVEPELRERVDECIGESQGKLKLLSVKVDNGNSRAVYRLSSTNAVIDWLEELVDKRSI